MSDTANYRNSITGLTERLAPEQAASYPRTLERVADDAKPFVSGMFKPGFVGEHDNPEPPTDAQARAQADLDEVLEDHAPNSKVAREARAALKDADAHAAEAQEAAEAAGNED